MHRVSDRIAEALGDIVTDYLRANRDSGASQEDLADATETPLGTFSNYIKGHRVAPGAFIVALAKATGDCRAINLMASMADCKPVCANRHTTLESTRKTIALAVDCSNEISRALEDNYLSETERAECSGHLLQLQRYVTDTLAALSNYRNTSHRAATLADTQDRKGA